MPRPRTSARRLPLAGAALSLALALAACGGSESPRTASAASSGIAGGPGPIAAAPAPEPQPEPAPTSTAAPEPSAPTAPTPKRATPPTTAGRTTTPPAPPPTTAGAPATAAPVTPKFAPGQRIDPTSAQVQGAITALTQRIPLFKPNEAQLRTFADATCTSFDQGQTAAQVQSTVRRAVTYVQGASLSEPDAEFAVRTVVGLRCPGYLP